MATRADAARAKLDAVLTALTVELNVYMFGNVTRPTHMLAAIGTLITEAALAESYWSLAVAEEEEREANEE